MADMATAREVREAKEQHPDAAVVSYVNTNADVKAESDVCCTSANAVRVVQAMEEEEIIFVPDMHLANYVATQTSKRIIPWKGYCYVHARMRAAEAREAKAKHPDALLLVHPECPSEMIEIADEVLSTGGMVRVARESPAREFLIATEEGLIYRLSRENPGKKFYPAGTPRTCTAMKKITLADLRDSLAQGRYEIRLPKDTMTRAEGALRRMIELS
jgi:quinolinate synthase